MTITEVPGAVHRLVMTYGDVISNSGIVSDVFFGDGDGFDPMNRVLQRVMGSESVGKIQGDPGVGWFSSDVEEEGSVFLKLWNTLRRNGLHPCEVFIPGSDIVVGSIGFSDVIGWGGHYHINRCILKLGNPLEAIHVVDFVMFQHYLVSFFH